MKVDPDTGHVTDPTTGKVLAVTTYYCAHCRHVNDGEGPCEHKDALALAMKEAGTDYHPAMPDADAVREWRTATFTT